MPITAKLKLYFQSPTGSLVEAAAPNGLTMTVGQAVSFQAAAVVTKSDGTSTTVYTGAVGGPWRADVGALASWVLGDENGKPTAGVSIDANGVVTAKTPGRYKIAAVWTLPDDAGGPGQAVGTAAFVFDAAAKPAKKLWLWIGGAAVVGVGLYFIMRQKPKALSGWND